MSKLICAVGIAASVIVATTAFGSTVASSVAVTFTPNNSFSSPTGNGREVVFDDVAGTLKYKIAQTSFDDAFSGLMLSNGSVRGAYSVFVANTGPADIEFDAGAIKVHFDGQYIFDPLAGLDILHVNTFQNVDTFVCSSITTVDTVGCDFLPVNASASHAYSAVGSFFGPNTPATSHGGFSFSKADSTGFEGVYEVPSFTLAQGTTYFFNWVSEANIEVGTFSSQFPAGYESAAIVDALNTTSLSIELPAGVVLDAGPTPGFAPTFVTTSASISAVPLPTTGLLMLAALGGLVGRRFV